MSTHERDSKDKLQGDVDHVLESIGKERSVLRLNSLRERYDKNTAASLFHEHDVCDIKHI